MGLQPWKERVIAEQKELRDKLEKLRAFRASEDFNDLPDVERTLLRKQQGIMQEYSEVLLQRIARFGL